MRKSFLVLFLSFFLAHNYAQAENSIAVVDLQKVVASSSQVKQLKRDHEQKMKELDKIIVNARGEMSNATDTEKVIQLEEKYMKEFNQKKEALEKEYSSRLSAIEKNIKDEIAQKAKKDNYEYVFAKSVVLFGGKDITGEINVK